MEPRVKHFYGIKLDVTAYPEEVESLLDEQKDPEAALSVHLLRKAGHAVEDGRSSEDELAEKTGMKVLNLGDEELLVIADTVTEVDVWGLTKVDTRPIGLEEVLKLEQYARWVGTDVRLGDWFFWVDTD